LPLSYTNGKLSDLEAIPRCDAAVQQGDKFKLYTQEPAELLPGLVSYAQESALSVVSLNTLKPRLEDVFLKMTAPVSATPVSTGRE
jgi:ABC-2 type transport system ATP-binding protein